MIKKISRPTYLIITGMFVGAASLIPGVSSGTVAVIAGIYDELIYTLRCFTSLRAQWRKHLSFILPLLTGIAFAAFLFARVIEYLLLHYPGQLNLFFVGLILGTIPFLYQQTAGKKLNLFLLLPLAIGFIVPVLLLLTGEQTSQPITALDAQVALKIFIAGFISTAPGIIPGISGSTVLVLIGMYSTLITAMRDFNTAIIAVLVLGALVGLTTFARLIHFLLERYYHATYMAIIGLILGSTLHIWPGLSSGYPALIDIFLLLTGFIFALFFHMYRATTSHRNEMSPGQEKPDMETIC